MPPPAAAAAAAAQQQKQPLQAVAVAVAVAAAKQQQQQDPDDYDANGLLYPTLEDPQFQYKIAQRKEFFDTQYDGPITDIRSQAEALCHAEFELLPHQLFVKNFLSMQTPYNSLLLYAGLGSGKTCSSIGIAEEMRAYMKQVGIKEKIIVIASTNVQDNFRLQLFDESKLRFENGMWNIQSCLGNSLLNEVNPTNLKEMRKAKLVSNIHTIIDTYYTFMGYAKFANYVANKIGHAETPKKRTQLIQKHFNNRLIIIDEVHNIRITDDNRSTTKATAKYLFELAEHAQNLRLLLLSATPMYNSHEEIVWLTNLMNVNDQRSKISRADLFDAEGHFRKATPGTTTTKWKYQSESGEDLLRRKLTGYVSYVRGENPYTFPYRIYQTNQTSVPDPPTTAPLYLTSLGSVQARGYDRIMQYKMKGRPDPVSDTSPEDEVVEKFGYEYLIAPLQALNMIYPHSDRELEGDGDVAALIGEEGLKSVMTFQKTKQGERIQFQYKDRVEHVFDPAHLHKYSGKIAKICDIIEHSVGIVMIYSQYLDSGLVPVALALEARGFSRFSTHDGTRSLMKNQVVSRKKYAMITGDKMLSPANKEDLVYINQSDNKYGDKVKVILLSKAGAEGLDFKNIRQVHLMDPWYNMSRVEQTIGRGVRNLSHCALPFEERNVEIYLHASESPNSAAAAAAPIDQHIYRTAHQKALLIGRVTRVLKESSVDCLLNHRQSGLTAKQLLTVPTNRNIRLRQSSTTQSTTQSQGSREIEYVIGDQPGTEACDYMTTCGYQCHPRATPPLPADVVRTSYHMEYVSTNHARIIERIRQLFREHTFYTRTQLVASVNIQRQYPMEQIFYALTYLMENKNELLVDAYGRYGNLVNRGNIYAFQPVEINDERASLFDRTVPLEYRPDRLHLALSSEQRTDFSDVVYDEPPPAPDAGPGTGTGTGIDPPEDGAYAAILADLRRQMAWVTAPRNETPEFRRPTKEWNDYMHLNAVLDHLHEMYRIDLAQIHTYMVYHYLDGRSLSQKLALATTQAQSQAVDPDDFIDKAVRRYVDDRILRTPGVAKTGILLTNALNQYVIYMRAPESGEWVPAEYTDTEYFHRTYLDAKRAAMEPLRTHVASCVGFMYATSPSTTEFKIKDIALLQSKKKVSGNSKGENLKKASKSRVIDLLNRVVVELGYQYQYTEKNTGKDSNISIAGLSLILEMLLRDSRSIASASPRIFYLTPEEAALVRIWDWKGE